MSRLEEDMRNRAVALERQASGFRTAGERGLGNTAHAAAMALRNAIALLDTHETRLASMRAKTGDPI